MCVLLVDDEVLILMEVAEALERGGYEVETAIDGDKAVRALENMPDRFTALVTDHRMPGATDGKTLATMMRRYYPDIPIVIATGTPDEIDGDVQAAHRLKVIAKPFLVTAILAELPGPSPASSL